jgi:hypothetical protein
VKSEEDRGGLRSILELGRSLTPAGIRRRAVQDGLLGGDGRWLAIGAVVWGLTLARRAWHREPEVVYRTKLRPGESVVVSTARPTPERRGRRARRRSAGQP